jgi:hypothetical protein
VGDVSPTSNPRPLCFTPSWRLVIGRPLGRLPHAVDR